MNSNNIFMLGYDYLLFEKAGILVPILAHLGHLICVGGSGAGKSTSILYWLMKLQELRPYVAIADFKYSNEFIGTGDKVAQFEDCYFLIKEFYMDFQNTPEGGCGFPKILIIDEIAGMLMYYSMAKETKQIAEEIRGMMCSLLQLARSRNCWLWLSMQRYSASIFPTSSGAADNFHICCGLGRLTVDGRMGLFANEHFSEEESLRFSTGRGIVLIDGQPLQSLMIPNVSKQHLLERLTAK